MSRTSLEELALCWLTAAEYSKIMRLKSELLQSKACQVRLALRYILSQYAPLSPNQWQVEYGPRGKPRLSDVQRSVTAIDFNISHSKDWLLVTVCQGRQCPVRLGCDIERLRHDADILPIIKHHFARAEREALMMLAPLRRQQRFFDLWVLKESYIKATGMGLAQDLKSFQFDLSQRRRQALILEQGTGPERELSFYSGTKLQTVDAPDVNTQWQVYWGRLDDCYRFAVTADINQHSQIAFSARQLSMQQVLGNDPSMNE